MPPANPKNLGLSLSATDLGLGDMLGQQQQDETDEARKKRLLMQRQQALNPGVTGLLGNNAALGGFGGYGG